MMSIEVFLCLVLVLLSDVLHPWSEAEGLVVGLEVHQSARLSATLGETVTLHCNFTCTLQGKDRLYGKFYRVEGGKNIYTDNNTVSRTTCTVSSIIANITLESEAVYYCEVKIVSDTTPTEGTGSGTTVTVYATVVHKAEYEAEQERIRKKKEQDVARLRALQERDRDHQAEQDALRARRNQEAAEREWRRKEKQDALNKAKEDEALTRDRLQQVAHKEHLLSVQAGRERSEFDRVLRALEKSIAHDKEKEEKSQWERFHNADGLRQQIREREAQAIENRRENFRGGERLNQEARDRRARLDEIKFKKLTELREAGLPEKYCKEVERKIHVLPTLAN